MNFGQDEYWSIDIPGLTGCQARDLRERLAPEFEFGVTVASPAIFMTRGFDRSTVELLADCLRERLAAEGTSHVAVAGARNVLEDFESWLAQAD